MNTTSPDEVLKKNFFNYQIKTLHDRCLYPQVIKAMHEFADLREGNIDALRKEGLEAILKANRLQEEVETLKASIKEQAGWNNVNEFLPIEGGRYWCYVEEVNSLGRSHFQWNCAYHEIEKRFSDDGLKGGRVTHWMPLPPPPKSKIALSAGGEEACNICGSPKVYIRGRYPRQDERLICPCCTYERLEQIYEMSSSHYGQVCSKPSTDHSK